ncbi:MAG: alpha/beta hydrolase [Saprospiraceae bacterium]|nr:alpha/beta hydrolase [Saprospiraceae bacterium]
MIINEWRSKGKVLNIDGHQIFYIDVNAEKEDTICFLHGYPSCSFDYYKVFKYFKEYRLIIHDHLGFGLSDKPIGNEYLLDYQAELSLGLWEALGLKNIHLVAHNYGTSIATALLYRKQGAGLSANIESLILCNGSMLIDMAQLRPIQRLLKNRWTGAVVASLASFRTFKRNMRNIVSDPNSFSIEDLTLLWKLLLHNNGRKVLPAITRYIDQRYQNYGKWIGALDKTEIPTLILWGDKDPVAVYEMANALKQKINNAKLDTLPGIGHYPMIEDSGNWSRSIINFIKSNSY